MPMKSYRQHFGACVVGLEGHEKILIYGYGSGTVQNLNLGFTSRTSQIDSRQPKQMTFEVYDVHANIWTFQQVNSGMSAQQQKEVFGAFCSCVTMLNFDSQSELENDHRMSADFQAFKMMVHTDKAIVV